MSKKKEVTFLITHSLSEIDVILPLIYVLRNKVKVQVIFAVSKIYDQFLKNSFYSHCFKELSIDEQLIRLPNKFDYRPETFWGRQWLRIVRIFLALVNYPKLVISIISSEAYFHESTNQYPSTRPLYFLQRRMKKKIFVYKHGHGIQLHFINLKKAKLAGRSCLLIFDKVNDVNWATQTGHADYFAIGYPKFYKEWVSFLKSFKDENNTNKKAIIYSRAIHSYYMDKDKYEKLCVTTCQSIRKKFGDIPIIIKVHPRENEQDIIKLIESNKLTNVHISNEHPGIAALNAIVAVSFWTSAVLDSLSIGVPSVEYYIEADRFREMEPNGSAYKEIGIDSVNNENDLELFFDRVLNGSYKMPKIIDEMSGYQNTNFVST